MGGGSDFRTEKGEPGGQKRDRADEVRGKKEEMRRPKVAEDESWKQ